MPDHGPASTARRAFWALKEREPAMRTTRQRARRAFFVARLKARASWHRVPLELDVAPDVELGHRVRVDLQPFSPARITIGPGCYLGDDLLIQMRGGSVELGPRVELRRHVILNVYGRLRLEGHNILSWGTVVHCADAVTFRTLSMSGEYVTVVDSTHYFTEPDTSWHENTAAAPVVIGYNTWLAVKATVTRGVTLGDHVIVGANSVVTSDVPDGQLVVGNPAQVVGPVRRPWITT